MPSVAELGFAFALVAVGLSALIAGRSRVAEQDRELPRSKLDRGRQRRELRTVGHIGLALSIPPIVALVLLSDRLVAYVPKMAVSDVTDFEPRRAVTVLIGVLAVVTIGLLLGAVVWPAYRRGFGR